MNAKVYVGGSFFGWDHGKRRDWGIVEEIDGDKVTVFLPSNPATYRYREESLKSMLGWIETRAIRLRRKRGRLQTHV